MKHLLIFLFSGFLFFALCNGWFLYRLCQGFVEIKSPRWAKPLLFGTMVLTSSTVVWIGDNNFALALPFYMAAFLAATKGDRLGRLTVGGIFFCFIMSVCAMSNTYMIPLDSYGWYDFASRAVRPVAYGVLYFFLKKKIQRTPIQLPHRLWKLCAGLTLLPAVTLSVLILPTYWMPDSMAVHNLTLFQGIFILPLSLIVSLILFYSILVLADYEQKAQTATLAEMREVYYQSLKQEQAQVRTLRHDLRNHLNAVLGLLEQSEVQKAQLYLAELSSSPALGHSLRICDNEIVNVVIACKLETMERQGVHGDIQISLPANLPFSDTDLCALFGNALDNALEAAQKSQNKKITLRCKAERGMFMLRLQNSLTGDEHADLSTTKRDKRIHGFGLAGMREIAKRYGGFMEAGPVDGQFELLINLPL